MIPTEPDRVRRVLPPLLLAGGIAAASLALRLRDPHVVGSWGGCPFFEVTGLFCPGCGGLRAVNDLTHGDLLAAASSNLLFVASIPVLAYLWVRWLAGSWRGRQLRQTLGAAGGQAVARRPLLVGGVVLGIAFVFTVLRNLPGLEWLAP